MKDPGEASGHAVRALCKMGTSLPINGCQKSELPTAVTMDMDVRRFRKNRIPTPLQISSTSIALRLLQNIAIALLLCTKNGMSSLASSSC
jgi:hypothetical protein